VSDLGRRFVFSPLEQRGLLLGLSPLQLSSIGGGVLVAVIAVHASPNPAGFAVAVVCALTGALGACLPVRGRALVLWLPLSTGWLLRHRHNPSLDTVPREGRLVPRSLSDRTHRSDTNETEIPLRWSGPTGRPGRARALGGQVDLLQAPVTAGQSPMGVLRDRRSGTWAAVIPVRGRAFALLDAAEKDRRLSSWGSVLAGLARAGTPIHRLQWVERTYAGDSDALHQHLARRAPLPGSVGSPRSMDVESGSAGSTLQAARSAYEDLLDRAGPATVEHESLVVVAVHPRHASRALRPFGRGPDAICGLLGREARLLQGQLRDAELSAGDPLDVTGLAAALRTGVDPEARRRLGFRSHTASTSRTSLSASAASAWPLAVDEGWSMLRADEALYATYWVAQWPRVEVGPDFLSPLLLAGVRRTVSLTLAPVPPERARREVEAARTADAADEELRRRAGFLATARHRREAEGVLQRESELADGHAEFRFSGYVTVSGPDRPGLEVACAEIEQAAQQSRIELRRLYGQQRDAFTWTLPLGRGLS
jgi:hypothetical protein